MCVGGGRYFLDNVAGYILEIDRGNFHAFQGNYTGWLANKRARLQLEFKKETARTKMMDGAPFSPFSPIPPLFID